GVAESRILHPLIETKLPAVRESLDRQHALIEKLIAGVQALLDTFVAAPTTEGAELLSTAVQYFVNAVFPHMEEEEALMPLLVHTFSSEQLVAASRALAAD